MGGLHFYRKRRTINYDLIREIWNWVLIIGLALMLSWFCAFFGKQVNTIGDSMTPVLENGDRVLVNRLSYLLTSPDRGDIIVFKPNGNKHAHSYIKMVVGLPGETIQYRDGAIYINGKKQYDKGDFGSFEDPGVLKDEVQIGTDEYFVLGLDLKSGEDSRMADIGNVKKEYIEGRAWFVASPRSKLGFVKKP